MKKSRYHLDLGAVASRTNMIVEDKKELGQRYLKGAMRYCFIFDSCFSSKKLSEVVMDIGAYIIFMVKTNTKIFCKESIEKPKKDWMGVSCLVFNRKSAVIRDRPIIAIGYKHNAHMVLYFIAIEDAGITNAGILYLYKYPDKFDNVFICPVAPPFVVFKLFGSVNDIEYHNK